MTTGVGAPKLGRDYAKLFSASTISNLGDGIGVLAYPWLASALTRNGLLIALVGVMQRLPWLLFSLPAGVITDRVSRRKLMVGSNVTRTLITIAVALAVWRAQDGLPGPDLLTDPSLTIDTNVALYLVLLAATLLLGTAEVLHDNAAQTFMPAVVDTTLLEKANGRLWSAEQTANTFVGPPVGAFLIAVMFSLPFFVDAATFAIAALLVFLIPASRSPAPVRSTETSWREELSEGIRWLWAHDLLRPMAIILGAINALGSLSFAIFVLFAQEVLETSATEFALVGTGGAVGGVVGGWTASWISRRLGAGTSLALVMVGSGVTTALVGLTSSWGLTWVLMAVSMMLAVLWNVITVSLRQSIIPDELLGRVNSVYRFFAWGMIPIGSVAGGLIVLIADAFASREVALRLPWFIAGALHLVLFAFAAPRLTTAKIEAARSAGTASVAGEGVDA